jgi:hypothetical protein
MLAESFKKTIPGWLESLYNHQFRKRNLNIIDWKKATAEV